MQRAVPVTLLAALLAVPLDGQGGPTTEARQLIPAAMKLLDHQSASVWQPAMEALAELRGTAVPFLVKRVRKSTRSEVLDPGAVRAVQILNRIGARAVDAVPALLDVLPDSETRLQSVIVLALGQIGPYSGKHRRRIRAAMVELVEDDPNVRGVDPGIATHVRQFIQQHQEAWRTHARTQLDPDASPARLLVALEDKNPFVREFAAELLAQPKPRSEAAVAALAKVLAGKQPTKAVMDDVDNAGGPQPEIDIFYDRKIHSQAARALVRMAPDDERALPAFQFLLERPVSEERLAGLLALRRAGPSAEKLLPILLRMAQHEDTLIRREAVTILGMIGPKAGAAIPTLKKLVLASDRQLAVRARVALRRIESRR